MRGARVGNIVGTVDGASVVGLNERVGGWDTAVGGNDTEGRCVGRGVGTLVGAGKGAGVG